MNKIAFMTLGCKVNQADTASMQELFRQAGYIVCDFTEEADVYVVNTCVVTNTGQQKSRQMIRRAVRKENDALIVVTGCYPQTAAEEVKAIDGVDLIIGTQDRAKIVTLVEAALDRKQAMKRASEVSDSEADRIKAEADSNEPAIVQKQFAQLRTSAVDDEVRPWEQGVQFEEMSGGNEADKTRAYLKIQEGCNQYCSYCIIPYARGPIRSRSLQSIKEEVQRLTKAGYREIVLIGIHLGCYGKEMKDGTTLYDAVQAAKARKTDILLVDTAGRLHNKKNLMAELGKIDRIITREYPGCFRENWVVLDGTTGQNAIFQAREFASVTDLTGIVLTKMDGTAKGGIAIAVQAELGIPVKFIGVGEAIEDLQKFNPDQFVDAIFY